MKIISVNQKTTTGSNRNGSYSISCHLSDYILSKSQFTFTLIYLQLDVKGDKPMVNTLRFPQSVKVIKMKRFGEEMIEEEIETAEEETELVETTPELEDEKEDQGLDSTQELKRQINIDKALSKINKTFGKHVRNKASRGDSIRDIIHRKSENSSDGIPTEHNQLGDPHSPHTPQSKHSKRRSRHSKNLSEISNRIVPTEHNKLYTSEWLKIDSNVIQELFKEYPKNKRLYTFEIVVECQQTVRTPFFDIFRSPFYIKSNCYLLNEVDSKCTESAEVFVKELGSLVVYNVNIDQYVISSNCSKLILKPIMGGNLSPIRSYTYTMATIITSGGTEYVKEMLVSIGPEGLAIESETNTAFIELSKISLTCMFHYPLKK